MAKNDSQVNLRNGRSKLKQQDQPCQNENVFTVRRSEGKDPKVSYTLLFFIRIYSIRISRLKFAKF